MRAATGATIAPWDRWWLACVAAWIAAGLGGQAVAHTDAGTSAASSSASAASATAAGPASMAASPDLSATAPASAPDAKASAPGASTPPAAPAGLTAQVEQPRAYGHVLGDVLRQRVWLPPPYDAADPARLPPPGRIDLWLERRASRLDTDADGRRWLVLEYQVVNAPQALVTTALPAVALRVGAGLPLVVAAWPLSIGPLTSTEALPTGGQPGGLQALQPDRAVAPIPTGALRRQVTAALAAMGAVVAAWVGWWAWRRWRDTRRLPFARAWHVLAPLRRAGALSAQPAAWQVLHHALNATAGRVIHRETLPRLVAAAPHLQPLHARLDAFYARSAERFFASPSADGPGEATASATAQQADPLLVLARDLRDAESRHAR